MQAHISLNHAIKQLSNKFINVISISQVEWTCHSIPGLHLKLSKEVNPSFHVHAYQHMQYNSSYTRTLVNKYPASAI